MDFFNERREFGRRDFDRRERRRGCDRGICASFGWNPPASGSIVQGQTVPFNQVITNASRECCDYDIKLNVGTGEIFVKDEGVYLISVDANVTLAVDEILTLTDGNGKSIDLPLYTDGSATRVMFVKCNSIVKLTNIHVTPIPFVVGTDLSEPIVAITIVRLQ